MNKTKQDETQITRYNIENKKVAHKKIMLISDLHSVPCNELENIIEKEHDLNYIFIIGDIFNDDEEKQLDNWNPLLLQLKEISAKVPIYCSLGNHEITYCDKNYIKKRLNEHNIYMLDDDYIELDDMFVYGFSSPNKNETKPYPLKRFTEPLERERTMVLCHRPTDYIKYLQGYCPFLTVSGHAHGGQWRLFGRGLYAPNEGLFPKYTSGFYMKKRLLVTRGLTNTTKIPRINNKPEIVILTIN